MKLTLPRLRTQALILLTLGLAGVAGAAVPFHFALVKSAPAAKETTHHVSEVKLWFTEAPSDHTLSIHVLTADGSLPATWFRTRRTTRPSACPSPRPWEPVRTRSRGVEWEMTGTWSEVTSRSP